MPVFDFLFWTKEHGDTLRSSGPIVPVEVGIPRILEEYCVRENIPIPPPVSGYALIDTGAFMSAVHEQLFQDFGIQPIDSIPTWTPHGDSRSFLYPAKMSFPALGVQDLDMGRVIGCELNWVTVDSKQIIMLLGRDLLQNCLFIYNSKAATITLSY